MKRFFTIFVFGMLIPGLAFSTSQPQKFIIHIPLQNNGKESKFLSQFDIIGSNSETQTLQILGTDADIAKLQKQNITIKNIARFTTDPYAPNGYTTPEQVRLKIYALAEKFPNFITLSSLGKSTQGRDIFAIKISKDSLRDDKPVVLLNAMHHAREVMTTEIVLHAVELIANQLEADTEINALLDTMDIVAIPQVNPDGNNIVHTKNASWRKNAYWRGRVVGVDLNRNYPTLWGACGGSSGTVNDQTYRGVSPGSEPETRAVMKAFEKYKPVANISYHSYGELIIYPFGCEDINNPAQRTFFNLAVSMSKNIINDRGQKGRYAAGIGPDILYVTDGTDNDWQWAEYGTFAYTIEVNSEDQGFQPNYQTWRDLTVTRQEGGWKELLRRVANSAAKAKVTSQKYELSKITYTVTTLENGNSLLWNSGLVKPFFLKNDNGLFYQILSPGQYQINFYSEGHLITSKSITMGNQPIDLGNIEL